MDCPRCNLPMAVAVEPTPHGRIELDYCRRCQGIWFDAQELAGILSLDNLAAFSRGSALLEGDQASALACPRDHHAPMYERQLRSAVARRDVQPVRIDQCRACEGIWLDGSELQAVARALDQKELQPFLENPDRPTSIGVWLFMLLTGLPVEQWHPRLRRPVAVATLVCACVLTFLWQIGTSLDSSVLAYGLVPARLSPNAAWPLLSHMFLHGGWAHLLGNMYFLWIFGDNVEDRLGRGRFLALYLLSGLGAALLHCALAGDSTLPVVGASGAISGVMAAYAVMFPDARLVSLIIFFTVRWRATTYLGMWLVLQVIGAAMGTSAIAWWAHIGGFVAGGVIAWRWRAAAGR